MITEEQLKEIEDRANKAAPGPWTEAHGGIEGPWKEGPQFNEPPDFMIYDEGGHTVEDAQFIAHAREDVPRLIAEVRRLRDEVSRLRERLELMDEHASKRQDGK